MDTKLFNENKNTTDIQSGDGPNNGEILLMDRQHRGGSGWLWIGVSFSFADDILIR